MTKAIIIVAPEYRDLVFDAEIMRELQTRVELVCPPVTAAELMAAPGLLGEVEVIFSSWSPPVMDAVFLAAAPRLRAVFHAAGTVKYFVTEAVGARGIVVVSAWHMNGEAVADYTLGAILFGLKQGFASATACRQQRTFERRLLPSGITGSTVALISLGAAGRAVRGRLRDFSIRVVAYDPYVTADEAADLNVTLVSLEEAFAQSDVVSLHTPLTPATIGLIGGEHFLQMRSGAVFINTARGQIVRQDEMFAALARRPDLTAVLDVTEPEPPDADSPAFTLPNVVLTPHIAGATGRDCVRLTRCVIEDFDNWLAGRPLRWEVKPEQRDRLA